MLEILQPHITTKENKRIRKLIDKAANFVPYLREDGRYINMRPLTGRVILYESGEHIYYADFIVTANGTEESYIEPIILSKQEWEELANA